MNKKMKSITIKRTRNSTNGSEQRNGRTKKVVWIRKNPIDRKKLKKAILYK